MNDSRCVFIKYTKKAEVPIEPQLELPPSGTGIPQPVPKQCTAHPKLSDWYYRQKRGCAVFLLKKSRILIKNQKNSSEIK
ncbi:hypothetical protein D3Z42_02480 [Lachnospiraceae bacterium]|nr:hypothetical protein [Lachnospiraceae bacterium]NBI74351.1 hypothetical protein [Lachnospiraceae bacterium]